LFSNQIVEVRYEGEFRRFCIESLSADLSDPSGLVNAMSDDIESLSIGSATLWTTGWDLTVHVVSDCAADQDNQSTNIQVCSTALHSLTY